jgi:hypothetical protein
VRAPLSDFTLQHFQDAADHLAVKALGGGSWLRAIFVVAKTSAAHWLNLPLLVNLRRNPFSEVRELAAQAQ